MDESEKSAYWIRVDKYEITDVEDKGTRIIVTTECITPDLRKETVTFSFDKESITSLKEKTPIESSKGLLEYKKINSSNTTHLILTKLPQNGYKSLKASAKGKRF